MQIVIVAGGGGTRLWPVSNQKTPKQFVGIIDQESLLTKTYNRLLKNFSPEQIWINTNAKYLEVAKSCLPKTFDPKKFVLEPEKRDNYAAILASSSIVAHYTSPKEPIIFVPCDDLVVGQQNIQNFNLGLIKIAQSLERKDYEIITAGIKPTFACTNYGYIQIQPQDTQKSFQNPVKVVRFKEKPDLETATTFIASGNFLWNKFNHSFTFESLQKNLAKIDPQALQIVDKIYQKGLIVASDYAKIPKNAFDYAVLENATSLGVMALDIQWEDLGNWEVVKKYLPKASDPNYKQLVEFAGQNNHVKACNNKKIAFVGVSDLIYIESKEGALIINPKKIGEIKKVSEYFDTASQQDLC